MSVQSQRATGDGEVQNENNRVKLKHDQPKGNVERKEHLTRKFTGGSNEETRVICLVRPENAFITAEVEANNVDKEKETVRSFDSEIMRYDNVAEIDGRTSAEACRNDIDGQKVKHGKQSLKNKRPSIERYQLKGSRGKTPTIAAVEDQSESVEVKHKSRRNERSNIKRIQSLQNKKSILSGRVVKCSRDMEKR